MIVYTIIDSSPQSFLHFVAAETTRDVLLRSLLVEFTPATPALHAIVHLLHHLAPITLAYLRDVSQLSTLSLPFRSFMLLFFNNHRLLSLKLFSLFVHYFHLENIPLLLFLLAHFNMLFEGLWLKFPPAVFRALNELNFLELLQFLHVQFIKVNWLVWHLMGIQHLLIILNIFSQELCLLTWIYLVFPFSQPSSFRHCSFFHVLLKPMLWLLWNWIVLISFERPLLYELGI